MQTAQPVGSAGIVSQYDLGVSPATIRNDLAALERMGLLTHPHTSAGRVPTDLGFRFFVHHLLAEPRPDARASRRRSAASSATGAQEVDQWLRTSTSVLARTAHRRGAWPRRRGRCAARFKHMELVHIHGTKVLLVLVLAGRVGQAATAGPGPAHGAERAEPGQQRVERAPERAAMPAGIARSTAKLSPFARQVAELVTAIMRRIDQHEGGQLFRDGLAEVLSAPEFAEGENVRRIVQVLEEPGLLEQIADEPARQRQRARRDFRRWPLRRAARREPRAVALRRQRPRHRDCWASSGRCVCATGAASAQFASSPT